MDDFRNRNSTIVRVIAIFVGFLCAFITTFIGIVAIPFTGYGFGLASVANHYLNISLGIELPLYIVLICIRRKVLTYVCAGMCIINYVGVFLLTLRDISGPIHAMVLLKLSAESIFFHGEISYIAVAFRAHYLHKDQAMVRQNVIYSQDHHV